jgi:pRiA4b ORF-3-like protein
LVPLRYAPPMEPLYIPPSVYQFRVVLQGISPLIWRRLLIPSDMSLATLHATLQIVFAWSDVHLHHFRIHGKEYGCARVGGPSFEDDPRQVPLGQLRLHQRERFTYVYNFIDHWVCDLRLEAVRPLDASGHHPVCLGGKRAAPPEDCGGAWAYLQMVDRHHVPLEAMAVVAVVLNRLLKADDQTTIRQIIGDRETFRAAVDQLDAYLQFRPKHFDRRDVNHRLCALRQPEGTWP